MNPPVPFARAVAAHGPTVLRVCRAVLGAGADAEDAWAETFLSALRAWPDLGADTNVEAWLVRVAGRRAIDLLRARERRPVPVTDLPERAVPTGRPGANPMDAVEAADLWDQVAALPERQRLAVAYHYLGGLPHAESAALIGGSAESVRRAAADGIRSLRSTMTACHAQRGAPQ